MASPDHQQPRPTAEDAEADVTLIEWTLSLTPAARLQVLQQHANAILELRERNAEN